METLINKVRDLKIYEGLIAINVIVFLLAFLIDPSFSTKTIVSFGAKVNYLITDGQWFRFITPIFLHLNFYHLGFNCLAIYILGRDMERIFGWKKMLGIYFPSGYFGSLLSFIFNESISAGASGAVFGLLGSHIFLYFTFKERYKKIYGNSFLVLIGINLAFGFIHPNIDNFGHIGGLIGGVLMSYTLHVKNHQLASIRKIIALILIPIIVIFSGFFAIQAYDNTPEYHIYKGLTLIQTENYNKAEEAIAMGKEIYPQYQDFNILEEFLNEERLKNDQ